VGVLLAQTPAEAGEVATRTNHILAVERDIGVKRIFTEPREPTFEEGYPEFLQQLGYAPDPNFEQWWSKEW
jgi:hypothetical protein